MANEKIHESLISGETPFLMMYKKIYNFFEAYSDGDQLKDYERKWAAFPREEFQKANAYLKSANWDSVEALPSCAHI